MNREDEDEYKANCLLSQGEFVVLRAIAGLCNMNEGE